MKVRVRGLVGMVRVRDSVINIVNEGPHKDIITPL